MASLNKVILMGNLTADPVLKQTQNGNSVCSFTIGVGRKFAKEGEQSSDFINIVAWRQTAEFIAKYFAKGSAICVCGALQTRSYDATDGSKRYVTEVVADEVTFVEKKKGSADNAESANNAGTAKETTAKQVADIADDDLPF